MSEHLKANSLKIVDYLKRGGWIIVGVGIGAIIVISALLAYNMFVDFPPKDGVEAWTMVAGIGALVTGVATVVFAGFALRGLRSLALSRSEMIVRATREAKLVAAQRLEEVATVLIPMNGPILNALSAANVQVFLGEKDQVKFDPDPSDLRPAIAWKASLPPGGAKLIADFLNRLEAWCVYFTTGVADEKVAFGPIGPVLRSWVGQYYPSLLIYRSGANSGQYPNLIKLYTLWSNEMDSAQLARLHQDLVAQMDRKQSELAKSQLPAIIGSNPPL